MSLKLAEKVMNEKIFELPITIDKLEVQLYFEVCEDTIKYALSSLDTEDVLYHHEELIPNVTVTTLSDYIQNIKIF